MTQPSEGAPAAEHFDVLIVGAGITGVGGAYHLTTQCPGKRFVVLEAQESFGGTWLTHKYPGIRSDSDLYTFGYRFKPWVGPPIATAAEIRAYMGEVIAENGLADHIRYNHHVATAAWSSRDNRWTLEGMRTDSGQPVRFTCDFLWMCQGYYRHSQGYTPDWPGMDAFRGPIVHPQTWPQDLDYHGKRVIVIGSGATAATVVPAIADDCAHVTLLQRSPTYFFPNRNQNRLADTLRELAIDETWIHEIVRRKIVFDQNRFVRRALEEPEATARDLLAGVEAHLPRAMVEEHFTPTYKPWRQRIAVVPDADLFEAIAAGKASVVTGHIDRFTETGVALKSGQTLEADIIVTATGFNMNVMGDIGFSIDGAPLDFAETVTWRGMMFTGVPNMLWVLGYFRGASWTLKADLICDFVCRLLNHMALTGARRVEVALRPEDEDMALAPWIDPETFNPGYLMRGVHRLPKRGEKVEWRHSQDYWREKDELPEVDLDGGEFVYDGERRRP
ncbi:MAG TPA: NAD(P)/FAD-dependent oxidoreductase [Caulobacteraceae bacterium]|jgi:cation diffusion facilitator CzcD-associated flavoprotein CzcO|nr:NAD(P)/FAD-dependent oxidoreductase [Caulobacteraceae bacterium]